MWAGASCLRRACSRDMIAGVGSDLGMSCERVGGQRPCIRNEQQRRVVLRVQQRWSQLPHQHQHQQQKEARRLQCVVMGEGGVGESYKLALVHQCAAQTWQTAAYTIWWG